MLCRIRCDSLQRGGQRHRAQLLACRRCLGQLRCSVFSKTVSIRTQQHGKCRCSMCLIHLITSPNPYLRRDCCSISTVRSVLHGLCMKVRQAEAADLYMHIHSSLQARGDCS